MATAKQEPVMQHSSSSHIINVQISCSHDDSSLYRGNSQDPIDDPDDELSREQGVQLTRPENSASNPFDELTGENESSDLRFSDNSRPTECNPTILRTLRRMRIQRSGLEESAGSVESAPQQSESMQLHHQTHELQDDPYE